MNVFISHNLVDKDTARLLGTLLVEQGCGVWFDEWRLRPGDSIVGGIELGIAECHVFALVWSRNASNSNWVSTELRAMLVRRVAEEHLRIVPIILDETPLPILVAEYKGFILRRASQLDRIAAEIVGNASTLEHALRIQTRLVELIAEEFPTDDPIRALFCPNCGSRRLLPDIFHDPRGGEIIYELLCAECLRRHGLVAEKMPVRSGPESDASRG